MKARHISDKMLKDFLNGVLTPMLEAVKSDDTLDLELRGGVVNIYYRGGSIFKITDHNGKYDIFFDNKYCTSHSARLNSSPSISDAVRGLPLYKQAMDWWFHEHPKYEREFQQVIARENNNHRRISGGTDYYIADIEYEDRHGHSRFDMVALKWLSKGSIRKDTNKVSLALIEVKYGDGALTGTAGIQKHLDDFKAFLNDQQKLTFFCKDMSEVFRQKCKLGLVDGLKETQHNVSINTENPEVIFIFANHDPDSKILNNILRTIKSTDYTFPILIAQASNMGYGLYVDNLHSLDSYK